LVLVLAFALAPSPQAAEEGGGVSRALFTTEIRDREPINEIERLPASEDRIYFFTELRGLEGEEVIHQWRYEGTVMAEVTFAVGGPRWRVWSSKELLPAWAGTWTVSVRTSDGEVLSRKRFDYDGRTP